MAKRSYFKKQALEISFEAGIKHALCLCGQSQKFPLCDGSHKGTDKKPYKFTLTKAEKINVCQCAKSKKLPHCDGSHLQ